MKVIDLLNKIANGEEVPKEVIYDNKPFYYDEEVCDYCNVGIDYTLFSDFLNKTYGLNNCLNDEVVIIKDEEEKKIPEKFEIKYEIDEDCTIDNSKAAFIECILADKINEIIDYLKSKGE